MDMQTQNRLLDDLARVASGALGTMTGLRHEIEALVRQRMESVLAGMDLVTREEFETVRAVAVNARAEQEALSARVRLLEERLAQVEASATAEAAGATPSAEALPPDRES